MSQKQSLGNSLDLAEKAIVEEITVEMVIFSEVLVTTDLNAVVRPFDMTTAKVLANASAASERFINLAKALLEDVLTGQNESLTHQE